MSLSADRASQISALVPRVRKSQFRARNGGSFFRFVSRRGPKAKRRDVAAARFRAIRSSRGANWCGHHIAQGWRFRRRSRRRVFVHCVSGRRSAGRALAGTHCARQGADRRRRLRQLPYRRSPQTVRRGKQIDTPFGAIYSPNLTPDRDTGLGTWSSEQFYRALHDGVAPDGSRYYPAFPYPNFTKLIRDEVEAIRVWLATLPPFHNPRRPPELRWPLNYRVTMRGWNFLFFRPGIFQPNQQKSAEWNRGGYLVPGSLIAAPATRRRTSSAPTRAPGAMSAVRYRAGSLPDSTTLRAAGLKSWSEEDITEYLQSGRNGKSHAGGPMAEVMVNSTSKMSDADIRAIAVYLKDLPPARRRPAVTPPPPAEMAAGKAVYASPASPATKPTVRARRGSIRRCPATRCCNRPIPPRPSHHPRRRADRDDPPRAQYRSDAGLRQTIVGPGDRRRHQLHPEFLGQRRAIGDAGAGGEGAESP